VVKTAIPEFRVSEISGDPGVKPVRSEIGALGPGSQAVALGRDDRDHIVDQDRSRPKRL